MYSEFPASRDGAQINDPVALEKKAVLMINDRQVATLSISPQYEKEFAIGFCLGEGILREYGQIDEIVVSEKSIKISTREKISPIFEKFLGSDCMGGFRPKSKGRAQRVESDFKISMSEILSGLARLQKESVVWKKTGGVHAAGLIQGDDFFQAEDISRHVAVDKVMGMGIQKGIDFSQSLLVTSGRLPGDLVVKAARMGIPVIASRTAVISSGIEIAEAANITLIGFVRRKSMNIYTHLERVMD